MSRASQMLSKEKSVSCDRNSTQIAEIKPLFRGGAEVYRTPELGRSPPSLRPVGGICPDRAIPRPLRFRHDGSAGVGRGYWSGSRDSVAAIGLGVHGGGQDALLDHGALSRRRSGPGVPALPRSRSV